MLGKIKDTKWRWCFIKECFFMEFQKHNTILRISIVLWFVPVNLSRFSSLKGHWPAPFQGDTFKSGWPVYAPRECVIPRGGCGFLGAGGTGKGESGIPTAAEDKLPQPPAGENWSVDAAWWQILAFPCISAQWEKRGQLSHLCTYHLTQSWI